MSLHVLISCVEKSEGLPKLILSYKAPRVAGLTSEAKRRRISSWEGF
jgi:hypothetical protein